MTLKFKKLLVHLEIGRVRYFCALYRKQITFKAHKIYIHTITKGKAIPTNEFPFSNVHDFELLRKMVPQIVHTL